MMMPNAGTKRGMFWMPEVGDEVVVAFESSDSNSPIILGALYNAGSSPPDQAKPSDQNNVRTLVSRSGHEVTLDDSPMAGKVTVKTQGGRSLTLDDTPPGKVTMQTPSGISVVLDDSTGTLTLSAPTSIVLETPLLQLTVDGVTANVGTGTLAVTPASVSIQSAAVTVTAETLITLTTVTPKPTGGVNVNGTTF
jgi:uncharacterized protein involved in type VI secretion and phage assembly